MTFSKKELLHQKIGNRMKQLAKEHCFTREDMSETIGYSCGHISRFYSGMIEIPDSAAQILSDLWHIRKEYILCEDDFRTDEEIYSYLNENSIKEMQAAIKYLETLDLFLHPCTVLHCPVVAIYGHLDELSGYIKKSEIDRLNSEYDFSLSPSDFTKRYFSDWCNVELSAPLPDMPFLNKEELTKESNVKSVTVSCSAARNMLCVNHDIHLFFKVYYHDKYVRTTSVHELQQFIKKLDAYSKCTIETILLDKGDDLSGDIESRK